MAGRLTAGRISKQAAVVVAATILFIAFSIWWVLFDQRPPGGGDPARHLAIAITFAEEVGDGDLLAPLTSDGGSDFAYPPLVATVGSVPALTGLPAYDWSVIALNLVFVPMLAAGCYLVGRLVYGRTAGMLAALFALGTPMVLSLFHVYLLDAPFAAAIALALWALLSTDDFTRRRQCVLAGALLGVALLVKTPAPVFLAGPVVVMLARGGWREWRNLGFFALAAFAIAAPYYLVHLGDYVALGTEATAGSDDPWTKQFGWTYEGWDRLSPDSFAMYMWSAVNTQYLLPLLALFAVGLVSAIRSVRERRYIPELLAGLAVGYLAMTLLSVHDPRYTLPLIVYVSVIATGWIATAERGWIRNAGAAFLGVVIALNIATSSLGLLDTVKIQLPGSEPATGEITQIVDPGALTVLDRRGYVVGGPRSDPFWEQLVDAAEQDGVSTSGISVIQGATWGTDSLGFDVLAHENGVGDTFFDDEPPVSPDLEVKAWWTAEIYCVEDGGCLAPSCGAVEDGVVLPGAEGIPLYVLVARRSADGELARWCDF